MVLYIPPTLRHNRVLGSDAADHFDYRSDFMNFLKDPELQQQRKHDRALLIGGGSEPRLTLLLDRVHFLNNSLASKLVYPSLSSNGPFEIVSAFADVTFSQCLFQDNNYPYSREPFVSMKRCALIFTFFCSSMSLTLSK